MIRRYDEVISQKSSKMALEQLKNDVNNNLQKEADKLTESNQKMTEFVNDEVNKIIDKNFDDQIRIG